MSVTPNLCCDETEPRSIHSPDRKYLAPKKVREEEKSVAQIHIFCASPMSFPTKLSSSHFLESRDYAFLPHVFL